VPSILACAADQVRGGVFCGPKEVYKMLSVAIPRHNVNYTHMVINGLLKYTFAEMPCCALFFIVVRFWE